MSGTTFMRRLTILTLVAALALLGTAYVAAAQYTRTIVCTTYPSGLVICR
jgi:hypothetical protein